MSNHANMDAQAQVLFVVGWSHCLQTVLGILFWLWTGHAWRICPNPSGLHGYVGNAGKRHRVLLGSQGLLCIDRMHIKSHFLYVYWMNSQPSKREHDVHALTVCRSSGVVSTSLVVGCAVQASWMCFALHVHCSRDPHSDTLVCAVTHFLLLNASKGTNNVNTLTQTCQWAVGLLSRYAAHVAIPLVFCQPQGNASLVTEIDLFFTGTRSCDGSTFVSLMLLNNSMGSPGMYVYVLVDMYASQWLGQNLDFNLNKTVSLFETNIRIMGGLLASHLLASDNSTVPPPRTSRLNVL